MYGICGRMEVLDVTDETAWQDPGCGCGWATQHSLRVTYTGRDGEHRLRILRVTPIGTPEVSLGHKDRDPGLR